MLVCQPFDNYIEIYCFARTETDTLALQVLQTKYKFKKTDHNTFRVVIEKSNLRNRFFWFIKEEFSMEMEENIYAMIKNRVLDRASELHEKIMAK